MARSELQARRLYNLQYRLLARFGLTIEAYEALTEKQKGLCAACGKPETVVGRGGEVQRLAIDHCSASNKIRGLLCVRCNRALGLVADSPELLRKLAAYLETNDTSHKKPGFSADDLLKELSGATPSVS